MAVRNEKTMEKKRIPVRPHHGMCLAYFIGKGYSEGFSAHMEKMLHILEQDVSIQLVVSLDEICSASGATDVLEADDRVWKLRRNCLESTRVLSLVSTSDDLVLSLIHI